MQTCQSCTPRRQGRLKVASRPVAKVWEGQALSDAVHNQVGLHCAGRQLELTAWLI